MTRISNPIKSDISRNVFRELSSVTRFTVIGKESVWSKSPGFVFASFLDYNGTGSGIVGDCEDVVGTGYCKEYLE